VPQGNELGNMAEQYQHLAQEMEPENFVGNLALQHGLNEA